MSGSLLRRVLDAHRMVAAPGSRVPRGTPALRADAVVFDAAAAALLIPAAERLGLGRAALDALAVPDDAQQFAVGPPSEQAAELVEWSRRHGLRCALPGSGTPFMLATEALAAPGRVVAGTSGAASGCGGLGALGLEVSGVEAATALAGVPLFRVADELVGVALEGVPAPGVGGVEVAAALARLIPAGAGARAIELSGAGVGELAIADRIATAALAFAITGCAVLFPSDTTTASWLESRGRGADWKLFERPAGDPSPRHAIALDALAPALIECLPTPVAFDLATRAGHPVSAVVLGPMSTLEDLAEFAHALRGRAIPASVRVTVLPAGQAQGDALRQSGLESALRDAGVGLGEPQGPMPGEAGGACLGFGLPWPRLRSGPRIWLAGPSACAASALAGVVRAAEPPRVARAPVRSAAAALPRIGDGAEEATPAGRPGRVREAHGDPLELRVVAVLGDGVSGAELLPWGARLEPLRHDAQALAAHALERVDPGFAARARALRPGLLVAGQRLGDGELHLSVAPALRELGVRVVLAASLAPELRLRLIEAGILPLRLGRAADGGAFGCGDWVELPSLAESLAPGRALLARNRVRGTRVVVEHDLDALSIALVRHGGLLALAREERGLWRSAEERC